MKRKKLVAWLCTAAVCFSTASGVFAAERADITGGSGEAFILEDDADGSGQGLNFVEDGIPEDADGSSDPEDLTADNEGEGDGTNEVVFFDDAADGMLSGEELPMDGIPADEDTLIFEPKELIEDPDADPEIELAAKGERQVYGPLSDPLITQDGNMKAGQKVTWSCVWFGWYPQTEIKNDNPLYEAINALTEWDNNNDVQYEGYKYHRIQRKDAVYYNSDSKHYSWSDDTTWHYFRYDPIKWRVLSITGETALLLSDLVLDAQHYNDELTSITWENSSLRTWLNTKFITRAFNNYQYGHIINMQLENKDSLHWDIMGGNATWDRVFLLAEDDIYYTEKAASYGFVKDSDTYDEARRCQSSEYAKAMGLYNSTESGYTNNCHWWQRSPGQYEKYAVHINTHGFVHYKGVDVKYIDNFGAIGVRPALCLYLGDSDAWSCAGNVCSDDTANEIPFAIPMDKCTIEKIESETYTGNKHEPSVTVTYQGQTLEAGLNYTVAYSSNVNAGNASVTVTGTGTGYYTGTTSTTFEIQPADINNTTVTLTPQEAEYTGAEIRPSAEVKFGGKVVSTEDYDISYEENVNVGTAAAVVVKGKHNFTGTKRVAFEIKPASLTKATVTVNPVTADYAWGEITPDVEVTYNGKTLEKDHDYTVSYKDNVDPGNATVIVTGKGSYTGSNSASFQILPIQMEKTEITLTPSSAPYTGLKITPNVEVKYGDRVLTSDEYSVSYQDNTNVGTATVTVTGKNSLSGEKKVTFEIQPISMETADVVLSLTSAAYTGSPITPEVTVKVGDIVLTADDYDVSCQNNTNVGTASVTITGKGKFQGTKTVTFEIREAPKPQDPESSETPKPLDPKSSETPILIATGAPQGNRTVILSWNEINGAKGYTVSYAEAGNQKMKVLGTTGKNTFKVKNLNKSKVYHFHVTADVSGNTIKAPNFIIAMPKSEKANVRGITVKNTSLELKTNDTAKIRASITKPVLTRKSLVARSKTIRYYSSNEAVAVVNKKGKVTAVGKGTCVIYAVTLNGISKSVSITVTE